MSQKHLLPCSCGLFLEIEPSQAGQQITCSCGQTQQAPTLVQIKNLPVAEEVLPAPKEETGNMRRTFFWIGVVVLVPSLIFLLWAVFISKPQPRDVSRKRTYYSFGQMELYQNSTPIPEHEHLILWIRDDDLNRMSPMELYFFFKRFEDGPNFSYNFQENYQALKDAWHIRVVTGCVLVFLGLLSLVSSFFMPKRDVIVTGWSGTEWA